MKGTRYICKDIHFNSISDNNKMSTIKTIEMQTYIHQWMYARMFIAELFAINKTCKLRKCLSKWNG